MVFPVLIPVQNFLFPGTGRENLKCHGKGRDGKFEACIPGNHGKREFPLTPDPNPKMSASKPSMAILVTVFSGSAFAFETPVKTCCPPGQFLAIEDWQGSRQYVEGLWFSQYHPGIIVLCSSLRTPPRRLPQRMGLPRLASNDAGQRYVSSDQGLQCP